MTYAVDGEAAGGRDPRLAFDDGLIVAIAAATARLRQTSRAVRHPRIHFLELDCVRHRIPPGAIAAAERRAEVLQFGAHDVLIASGQLSEERYFRSLAASLGLLFVELGAVPRDLCPLLDATLLRACQLGTLPLSLGGETVWVVSPQGVAVRQLTRLVAAHPDERHRLLVTSPAHIRRFTLT